MAKVKNSNQKLQVSFTDSEIDKLEFSYKKYEYIPGVQKFEKELFEYLEIALGTHIAKIVTASMLKKDSETSSE